VTLLFSRNNAARRAMAVIGVAAISYSIAVSQPHPSLSGHGLAVLLLTALAALAWLGWARSAVLDERVAGLALAMVGVPGAVLAVLSSSSGAVAFPFVAVFTAARVLELRTAAAVALVTWAALAVASLAAGHPTTALVGVSAGLAVTFLGGRNVRDFVLGRERAELLLAETQVAREEQARSAALAERARIAREIHDVLAHSLSALAVQLEGARMVLAQDGDPRLALTQVEVARGLARAGLEETRRAIGALRGDALPLPRMLEQLVAERQHAAAVSLHLEGPERATSPEVSLAAYRVAQEAITNALRHAPGSTIDVCLAYGDRGLVMTVIDRRPASGDGGPQASGASDGGGYGLIGMRERADLLGGSVTAGPTPDGWRVELVVPS
jgi:signal transduction histidine kinase